MNVNINFGMNQGMNQGLGFNTNLLQQETQLLRKAMKGLGTDEDAIIKIVGNRSNAHRLELINVYRQVIGRDLLADLKDELSGNFREVVKGMFMSPIEYDAYQLNKAMKGLGTDEDTLIEIMGSRSNSQIIAIRQVFFNRYQRDLVKELIDETSGDFQKLLVLLAQGKRSENTVADFNLAAQDAQQLLNAGEGQWGTDESVFLRILTQRSPHELFAICQQYEKMAGKTIFDSIDSEFSGDTKECLKTIIQAMINPSQYFATRIRKACKGLGTDDGMLIRVLVSRDEVDLPQIKAYYLKMYGKDLLTEIRDECSGDYKNMLLELASH